jgi:hypothetical protein
MFGCFDRLTGCWYVMFCTNHLLTIRAENLQVFFLQDGRRKSREQKFLTKN